MVYYKEEKFEFKERIQLEDVIISAQL